MHNFYACLETLRQRAARQQFEKSEWLFWSFFGQIIFYEANISIVHVAAHLRGMRPTPSTKKDTLMLRKKLKLYLDS